MYIGLLSVIINENNGKSEWRKGRYYVGLSEFRRFFKKKCIDISKRVSVQVKLWAKCKVCMNLNRRLWSMKYFFFAEKANQ